MTPSRQTAINEKGFFFKLPALGLVEPDIAWVTIKAGIGTKEAVSALIEGGGPAPIRIPQGEHRVFEVEKDGYIWFLPFLNPPLPQPQPDLEVFTLSVRRGRAATVSNGVQRRVSLPAGTLELSFVNPDIEASCSPDNVFYSFPKLGQPKAEGEWVRVIVGIGSNAECLRQIQYCDLDEAPLRIHDELCGIMELEVDGAVWFVPTRFKTLRTSSADVFSAMMHRLPASAVPAASRVTIPRGNDWVFLDKRKGKMGYGAFQPHSKDLLEQLGSNCASDALILFRKCSDPLPSQCQLAAPLAQAQSAQEAAERDKKKEEMLRLAWGVWHGAAEHSINKAWFSQLQHSATYDFTLSLRISPEEDGDVRGIDYALCRMGDDLEEDALDWEPLPAHAGEESWARTGVNLKRFELGERLIMKDEWARRRPTSLMMSRGAAA